MDGILAEQFLMSGGILHFHLHFRLQLFAEWW